MTLDTIESPAPSDLAGRERLRERNWIAFQEYYPPLAHMLREHLPLGSSIVGMPGGGVNIDLGHTHLYEPDAETFTRRQIADYLASPHGFNVSEPPYPWQTHHVNHQNLAHMYDWMSAEGITFDKRVPMDNHGTLIIFGIGLGFHIEPLMNNVRFRNIIFLDQTAEFLIHSFDFVDWRSVFERILERKGRITFLLNERPEILAHHLYWEMRGPGFALIDGSFIYRHYASFILDEAHRDFNERMPTLCHSAGFIEDEAVMIRNCSANLARYDGLLLHPRPRLRKETPVFIVGSGPSVDSAIDTIRRFRDQIILVSGGTSLRVLLANGLRPDYHCELENVPVTYNHTADLAAEYGLEGITLIASTTVDPRVPGCFEKRVFYFREVLSSTLLFGQPGEEVIGTAPTCTNLAVRALIELGFHKFYFFGLDYGTRETNNHHSKQTVYMAIKGYPYGQEGMTIPLDGNFGGTVYTNGTLMWSKQMMSTLLAAHGTVTAYNCSDGAQITATIPLLPESIQLASTSISREREMATAWRELRPIAAGELFDRAPLAATVAFYEDRLAQMIEAVRASIAAKEDFVALHDRLIPLVPRAEEGQIESVTRTLVDGSLTLILQFGHFGHRRLEGAQRAAFVERFATNLLDCLISIRDQGVAMLRGAMTPSLEG